MEIELKFLISAENKSAFEQIVTLGAFSVEQLATANLTNAYYDTPDNILRQWDTGLRTRIIDDYSGHIFAEQTVKLAGQDVAGLQKRPEYNIDINIGDSGSVFANLALFESSIWPENFPIESISKNLNKVFETRFERKKWNITLPNGALVECVLDSGVVEAEHDGKLVSKEISEFELELIEGEVSDLFEIAFYLTNQIPAKLGLLSKAAIGYQLAQGTTLVASNLELAALPKRSLLEPSFELLIGKGIEFIQHNEVVFSQTGKAKAFRRIMDGVSFLIRVLELFSPYMPNTSCEKFIEKFRQWRGQARWIESFYQLERLMSRKSPYRKDIEKSEQLLNLLRSKKLPDEKINQALNEFSASEFNQMFLSFLQWLATKGWRLEMTLSDLPNLSLPVKELAAPWLENTWQNVSASLEALKRNNDKQNIETAYWTLANGLLTGLVVGSLYSDEQRELFRSQLLHLLLGFEESILLSKLESMTNAELDEGQEEPEYRNNIKWLQSKQKSLQIAVTASVDSVLNMKPYW